MKRNPVVVVRAHGISPDRRKYLQNLGLPFRDGTCPDVGIIAGKIKAHAERGYEVVIFGDPKHPEVAGLLGYAKGHGHVITNEEDLKRLPHFISGVGYGFSVLLCLPMNSKTFHTYYPRNIQILSFLIPFAGRPRKGSRT
jgi:hypothetical protein